MTTSEKPASALLADLRARGLRVTTLRGGGLRVEPRSRLSPEDRASLRRHASALLVLLALERARAQDAADTEAEQRETVRALEERTAAERTRLRRAAMADWDEEKVLALIDADKLSSADDVKEWRQARAERRRAVERATGMLFAARLEGRAARIVRTLDGEIVVEVGRPTGYRSSTWAGGFFGFLARTTE